MLFFLIMKPREPHATTVYMNHSSNDPPTSMTKVRKNFQKKKEVQAQAHTIVVAADTKAPKSVTVIKHCSRTSPIPLDWLTWRVELKNINQ